MVSLKVGSSNIFVAPSALVNDAQFEPFFVGPGDRMRRMTVIAHRQRFISFRHGFRVHTLFKLFINALVTLGTGFGNATTIDAGCGVIMG
jgi:hypothetical protein